MRSLVFFHQVLYIIQGRTRIIAAAITKGKQKGDRFTTGKDCHHLASPHDRRAASRKRIPSGVNNLLSGSPKKKKTHHHHKTGSHSQIIMRKSSILFLGKTETVYCCFDSCSMMKYTVRVAHRKKNKCFKEKEKRIIHRRWPSLSHQLHSNRCRVYKDSVPINTPGIKCPEHLMKYN